MRPTSLALMGLIAGIEERYFDSEVATTWGLRQLETLPPAGWLSDVVCCGGINDALDALWHGYHAMDVFADGIDLISLRLGYGFLAHRAGERSLAALLQRAGELTDGAGYNRPECEAFYLLLNEIDGGGPTEPSSTPLTERVELLFGPHVSFAKESEAEILGAAPG